jgi:hypothetical protein
MRAEEAKSHYNQRIRERPFNLKGGLWVFSKKIFCVDCIVGFLINKEFEFEFNWYFTISVHLKSGLIRWVASVEEDN